ncbi:MAG: hypothetical protein NTV86_12340 [Planctomycetota bacterium]|nr:hypothetical protein [Planctomycetota bacterium]
MVVSPTSVPAQGAQKPAAAVIVTATTRPAPGPAAPAAGMTPAQRERQRLLDEAAKALREAKEALGDPLPGEGAEGTKGAQGGTGESPRGAGGSSSEGTAPAAAAANGPAAAGLAGDVTVVKWAQVPINLGSRNGLKKETRMYVHRGSQFIGVLQLTTVEAQSAQGIVDGRLSAAIGDQAVVFGE